MLEFLFRSRATTRPVPRRRLMLESLEARDCPSTNPVLADDSFAAVRNQILSVQTGVLANDSDPDGLVVDAVNGSSAAVGVTTSTGHGSVTLQANGTFTYRPQTDY